MDAELERLAREAASGDRQALARHAAALLRAGRREQVEAFYWAAVLCPGQATEGEACARCARPVRSDDPSLCDLGRWIDHLIEEGAGLPDERLHLNQGRLRGGRTIRGELRTALAEAGAEPVLFELGRDPVPRDVLRWWPRVLRTLAAWVEPGRRPVVVLRGRYDAIVALAEVADGLGDLLGVVALGEGGAATIVPDRYEDGPVEATVREWLGRRR